MSGKPNCASLFQQVAFLIFMVGAAAYSDGWECKSGDEGMFKCHNGINCVPIEWVCNGLDNCPDGSDEKVCRGFLCPSNDRWIPDAYVCNGYANCEDGADEEGCDCPEYTCPSGACYSSAQRCDKINDCGDSSDEPSDCDCPTLEFTCESGYSDFTDKCLAAEKVCDGVSDCLDGSDEHSSRCSVTCAADETRCDTGVSYFEFSPCINSTHLCDDYAHCADHSDETSCPGCSKRCLSRTQTNNGSLPIYLCADYKQCDYTTDCLDGSDEKLHSCSCYNGIRCSVTDLCIPNDAKCDGENYCGDSKDWTDECSCYYNNYDQQYCSNTARCLAPWQICDGVDDCGDRSDESFCPADIMNCEYFHDPKFQCDTFTGKDDRCIDMDLVCNGYADCIDASDETICNEACSDDYIRCATGTSTLRGNPICISENDWCDYSADCYDHSDENTFMCKGWCEDNGHQRCQSPYSYGSEVYYSCIDLDSLCDGDVDCAGREDENSCCPAGEYSCLQEFHCIPNDLICDNREDCSGGDDEVNCGPCDTNSTFECDTGRCILRSQYCDGENDCADNSDEPEGCEPYNDCSSSEYRCSSGDCVPLDYECDGFWDCGDGSDETSCPSATNRTADWRVIGPIVGGVGGAVILIIVIVSLVCKYKVYRKCRRTQLQNARSATSKKNVKKLFKSKRVDAETQTSSTFHQSAAQHQFNGEATGSSLPPAPTYDVLYLYERVAPSPVYPAPVSQPSGRSPLHHMHGSYSGQSGPEPMPPVEP